MSKITDDIVKRVYVISFRQGEVYYNIAVYANREEALKAVQILSHNTSGTYEIKQFEINGKL